MPTQVKKKKWSRFLRIALIIVVVLFIGLEIALRTVWGFADAVLYKADPKFEYIAVPSQDRRRFGNNIYVNAESQRSAELSKDDSLRILFFGDSVANGGSQTDQDSLASTKISKYLTAALGKKVLAMNISAGSWGPDNCYGYLQQYGDFQARSAALVVSSHDAYDNMDFQPVVGVQENYPAREYKLATWELLNRYLIPRLFSHKADRNADLLINKKTETSAFNTGFDHIYQYCLSKNIPLIMYLHADEAEWKAGKYNQQGEDIIRFCKEHNVRLIKELDHRSDVSIYRDDIHLNDRGQEYMFQLLKDSLVAHQPG